MTVAALVIVVFVTAMVSLARPATSDKRLDRIKGDVAFTAADGGLHHVFGHEVLPDDDTAITQFKSAASLTLPDSSIVALGENTRVKVGAFTTGTDGPGSTIFVQGGTLRFDIRRPTGGQANYHFTTTTSQIAVRGTVGLLSFVGGNTTVACLACAADSVTVTVGQQALTVATGQVVTVTATGAVVSGSLTSATLSSFSQASVSTSASSGPAAAVSGVTTSASSAASGLAGASTGAVGGAASGAAGGLAGGAIGAVAGGVAGAVAVGVAVTQSHTSTPPPTQAPTVTPTVAPSTAPTASPSPSPSPTPNAPLQLQKHGTAPTIAPTPAMLPGPPTSGAAPRAAVPPGVPGRTLPGEGGTGAGPRSGR